MSRTPERSASKRPERTAFDRTAAQQRLRTERFDVLVIGAGITGAGVALDAAERGLRVALLDKADFASGTSSKSSKLVHGGLRYLQQREFLLVYEALAERQRLLRNAPHLVSVLPFLIPLFGKDGMVNKTVAKTYSTALWLYDITGGLRIGKRHKKISRDEARAHLPTVRMDRLVQGWLYYDARADDARLTLTIARTAAAEYGAVLANYTPVAGLLSTGDGRVVGVRLADGSEIRAGVVVNAAGVWAEEVEAMDQHSPVEQRLQIRPAKGVHITVPGHLVQADIASVINVPGDKRSVFVVPWEDRVYVGTTDTDYDGPLDNPPCTEADVDYLLRALNSAITTTVSKSDVLGVWAGLRPLIATATTGRTADLSRRHTVRVAASGLITVTGGKLTTYRKMAADTVDAVVTAVGRGRRKSGTASLPLLGARGTADLVAPGAGAHWALSDQQMRHLVSRHGSATRFVLELIAESAELARPLVPGLPYLSAEAVYACRYEMATGLDDVVSRRTRARLLDRGATNDALSAIAELIAPEFGWDADEIARQVATVRHDLDEEARAAAIGPAAASPVEPVLTTHTNAGGDAR